MIFSASSAAASLQKNTCRFTMADSDGVQRRRQGGKEQGKEQTGPPPDGEESKKGQAQAGGKRKAGPNESAHRAQVRRELTDGAFEKLLANLAAVVVVGGILWLLVKIGIL
jgi:hypothetical protein